MDLTTAKDLGPALGGLLGAVVSAVGLLRGSTQMRKNLKADADVVAVLPEGPQRDRLLGFVDDQIEQLIEHETIAKRNWPLLIVSVASVIGLGALAVWLITLGQW